MSESIDTNRRGFLSRFSQPVKRTQQAEITPRLVARPPHAVDEALFVRLCDGCGECLKVCPNSVIELDAQLAQLNLDYNQCSLCGECVKACPSDALHTSVTLDINLRPDFTQSCDNYLQTECQQCASACPQHAISVQDDELPHINNELCNGCGQCRISCYSNAILMKLYNKPYR
ncbi:ferredoxin-type protein [Vibrio alginolyticus]|uniref:Ferredoxin-type protein n=1 Tax=Vibrio alginolyticus TaxID=663 RepID=A0A1W6UL84_VIBAL|nr:ferredoxin-type protein NapF [Vibrio alginolyticus]ARO98797.1 ferredoxin-type protein [Vibrio alginolyticus]ARP03514.1 ferredoxin-type protein [Vibrio alginolyticus]ARP08572.1 ferredoxin-type protein [Vibrio alginolyticus]ARP13647.1 ferredoxin-type protein [Vibrio alginolyticus]ARP18707.1 ferredoxin-type protein [Vibrio alginolyticus]